MTDTIRTALEAARERIHADRESFVECSTYPNGFAEPDDRRVIGEYDALLAQIDAALAQEPRPATVLPDGSAFFVASLPLPADHWLYAPRPEGWDADRDCLPDTPHPILTHASRDAVTAAVRYAVRGATARGTDKDFDPDALVQNAVYALCGPYGKVRSAS